MLYHPFLILKGILKTPNGNHPDHPIFFYRGDLLMALRKGPYKMHMITWATPEKYQHISDVRTSNMPFIQKVKVPLLQGFCPGQYVANVTTVKQLDHSNKPIIFNIDRDPGETFPLRSSSKEYQNGKGVEQRKEGIQGSIYHDSYG